MVHKSTFQISRKTQAIIMYIVFFIFLKLKSFIGKPYYKQSEFTRFGLRKEECDEFISSLDRIRQINDNLMQHIVNLQKAEEEIDFCIHSLPLLKNNINKVNELRINSKARFVCEYEFTKFIEFFYHTLHYIMEKEKKLLKDFCDFSKISILPFLEEIEDNAELCQSSLSGNAANEKSKSQKIDEEVRKQSLINFCLKFLKDQKIEVSQNQLDSNNTMNELLTLCLNIIVRFDHYNCERSDEFVDEFVSRKYLISTQFQDFLFDYAEITGIAIDARGDLNEFLWNNNLDLESKFLNQGIFPPMFDTVNSYASIFNLPPVD